MKSIKLILMMIILTLSVCQRGQAQCTLSDSLQVIHGSGNAYVIAHASGGTAPYHYVWSTGSTYSAISTTVSGVYCVTITDTVGCQVVSCDTVIVNPCTLGGHIATANYGSYAVLTTSVTGAHGHVTFLWTGGTASNVLTVTTSNVYCVTLTDSLGCTALICDTVSLTGCSIQSYTTNTYHGSTSATLQVHASSNYPPLSYHWANGVTTDTMTVWQSGIYCVTVTDSVGCHAYRCDTVTVGCAGLSGSIHTSNYGTFASLSVTVTGSSGHLGFFWGGGASGPTRTVTTSGNYCLYVLDSSTLCTLTLCDSVILTGCNLQGYIYVTPHGAGSYTLAAHSYSSHPPYTYLWSNGSTSDSLHATQSGIYCVTITDSIGCHITACDTVHIANNCTITGYIGTQNNGSYAILTANISGNHGHVTYHWANSASNTLTVTASGVYCVTATDSSGCYIVLCDTINLNGCTVAGYILQTAHGAGYTLAAHVYAGHAPYTYLWSNGSTSDSISVTASGIYCVRITDSTGCYIYKCDTININGCTVAGYIYQVAHGGGYTLAAHVYAGHAPYTYLWSNGSTSDSISVTASGIYCVRITDSTGCYIYKCDTIHIGCSMSGHITANNGSGYSVLTANITGAHGHITYHWSNSGSTSNILTVQSSGLYCVTATDSSGCSVVMCDSVHVGCGLHAYIIDSARSGYNILYAYPYNGTGPYTYHWSNGSTSSYLAVQSSGRYCVTITDHNGCTAAYCDSVIVNANIPCHAYFYFYDSCNGNVHFYNYSSGSGLTYSWDFGDGHSATTANAVHHYAAIGTYHVTLSVHGSGGCTDTMVRSVIVHSLSCATTDTICGTVFYDTNGNGVQDNGEHGVAGQRVNLGSGNSYHYAYTDSNGHYIVPVLAGLDYIYYYNINGYSITIPLGNGSNQGVGVYDSVNISGGGIHCGYDFGVVDSNVTISGYVYLDANGNGMMDAGETGISGALVYIGPHGVYTNASGHYTYVGHAGSYSISHVPSSAYAAYTVAPTSYFVAATSPGSAYAGNDFGLSIVTTTCNIATQIIPHTTVTAGYPAWYYVYVSNYGTNTASGTMTFFYDPALTFTSASPAQTSINTASHTITFNYSGLLPGHYQAYFIDFSASSSVTVGQSTFEMATATDNCIESNLNDNTDTVHQAATGSWDPNDKIATPAGSGPQGLIAPSQELRYTINFQNTGTAPAVNVVIRDMLPSTLDLNTLKIVAASHPNYAVQIENGELVCRFSQIMLPDSFVDPAGSQGFLCFAISPMNGLAQGTQIQNTANIYFDYNTPVATNATLNTIDYKLSINDIENHATITVMPNPMKEYTTITVSGINTTNAILDVYNTIGQSVSASIPAADGTFHFGKGTLGAGIYIYHIKQGNAIIGTGKLVIE